eukprot:TRINITY_DN66013_c10_g1_i1.p2 TRINITY_DN66013_c10_g1~~TRINITY_DN66013_c10_g1_i1.p2  ORF type:complete len:123 (+),score=56.96 TRINITY_DN66013_c10_g1_i1:159-527(+)
MSAAARKDDGDASAASADSAADAAAPFATDEHTGGPASAWTSDNPRYTVTGSSCFQGDCAGNRIVLEYINERDDQGMFEATGYKELRCPFCGKGEIGYDEPAVAWRIVYGPNESTPIEIHTD